MWWAAACCAVHDVWMRDCVCLFVISRCVLSNASAVRSSWRIEDDPDRIYPCPGSFVHVWYGWEKRGNDTTGAVSRGGGLHRHRHGQPTDPLPGSFGRGRSVDPCAARDHARSPLSSNQVYADEWPGSSDPL